MPSVRMQARQHAKQARLNDAFPLGLHWLTRSLSLAALPVLALAFAGYSLPPMTTADLARPPVLPANTVSFVLLAAAGAWALLCLMHVRMERNRCDMPPLASSSYSQLVIIYGMTSPATPDRRLYLSGRVRAGPRAPKGAVRMSLQGPAPPVTIIRSSDTQQVCLWQL